MLVLVVDIMWKSLLLYKLVLPYKDNLIRCDAILKNKNIFILMVLLKIIIIIFMYIKFFIYKLIINQEKF